MKEMKRFSTSNKECNSTINYFEIESFEPKSHILKHFLFYVVTFLTNSQNTTNTMSNKVLNVTHDRFGRRSPSHPLTTKTFVKKEELVG